MFGSCATDVSRREQFAARFCVPRETLAKFDAYHAALCHAQARLNLIAPSTLHDIWTRHFADSAQLQGLGRSPWLDVGCGAGLPGIVLAILGERVELIDARMKKVGFVQAVIDELGLTGTARVRHERIEKMNVRSRTIVARALAPISRIFDWTVPTAGCDTVWVLPKGRTYASELADAAREFQFKVDLVPSLTSADSRIVLASAVRRA